MDDAAKVRNKWTLFEIKPVGRLRDLEVVKDKLFKIASAIEKSAISKMQKCCHLLIKL